MGYGNFCKHCGRFFSHSKKELRGKVLCPKCDKVWRLHLDMIKERFERWVNR